MHPLRISPASGIEYRQYCPYNQFQVPEERGVIHIIHIQFQADREHLLVVLSLILKLIPIDIVPEAGLRSKSARHGGSNGILATTSNVHLIHGSRTRTYYRHRAIQDVYQLWQLINLQPSHNLSPPEDTILVRTQRSLIRPTSYTHRAELPHLELSVVLAHAVGKVEQRAGIADFGKDNGQ